MWFVWIYLVYLYLNNRILLDSAYCNEPGRYNLECGLRLKHNGDDSQIDNFNKYSQAININDRINYSNEMNITL